MWELSLPLLQEDIDKGRKCSCRCCPIALALDRYFNRPEDVLASVTLSTSQIYTFNNEGEVVVDLFLFNCEDTQRFIKQFDAGVKVEPQTVHFTVSPEG